MLALSFDQNSRTSNGAYVFSSQPRVVQQRNKHREYHTADAIHHLPYSNLMFEKRVARGNTFSNTPKNTESAYQSLFEKKSYSGARKQISSSLKSSKKNAWIPSTPEPVEGRQHIKLQTELYLEELSGIIEEMEVSCQTDPFLDRPPTPLFIPAKTGMDQETQIYDGDLFDFDLEVQPILEVLVGKVTEQALIEVMEEEELASLRERQKIFEEMREAELQEQQRLEEVESRRKHEKLLRMKQQEEKIKQDKETAEKIAAKVYAQQLLIDLVPSVLATLSENGFFHDPVEREIETNFFPSLLRNVRKNLSTHLTARRLLDGLIRETVIKRLKMSQGILRKIDSKENSLDERGDPLMENDRDPLVENDGEPTARSWEGPEDQANETENLNEEDNEVPGTPVESEHEHDNEVPGTPVESEHEDEGEV